MNPIGRVVRAAFFDFGQQTTLAAAPEDPSPPLAKARVRADTSGELQALPPLGRILASDPANRGAALFAASLLAARRNGARALAVIEASRAAVRDDLEAREPRNKLRRQLGLTAAAPPK